MDLQYHSVPIECWERLTMEDVFDVCLELGDRHFETGDVTVALRYYEIVPPSGMLGAHEWLFIHQRHADLLRDPCLCQELLLALGQRASRKPGLL